MDSVVFGFPLWCDVLVCWNLISAWAGPTWLYRSTTCTSATWATVTLLTVTCTKINYWQLRKSVVLVCVVVYYNYSLTVLWNLTYSQTLSWMRSHITFSLPRSAIQCIRGSHSHIGSVGGVPSSLPFAKSELLHLLTKKMFICPFKMVHCSSWPVALQEYCHTSYTITGARPLAL